jgi:hypothetical protein
MYQNIACVKYDDRFYLFCIQLYRNLFRQMDFSRFTGRTLPNLKSITKPCSFLSILWCLFNMLCRWIYTIQFRSGDVIRHQKNQNIACVKYDDRFYLFCIQLYRNCSRTLPNLKSITKPCSFLSILWCLFNMLCRWIYTNFYFLSRVSPRFRRNDDH